MSMSMREALELTRKIRISDDENSLCFKSMVVFWIGGNYGWELKKTVKTTKYPEEDVKIILGNWVKSEILIDGKIHGDFDGENDWMEIILISMCGSGDIIRISDKYGMANKIENNMTQQKTLNEHLFAQLERLSSADETTIKTEVEKAANIVMVSEQILNVARLKLDIISAGQAAEAFSEVDTFAESKKKLQG